MLDELRKTVRDMKRRGQDNLAGSQRQRGPSLAILADLKLGCRPEEGIFIIGSRQLWDEMVAAGWLRPVVNRHKLQLFDRGDISRAWTRILNGEQPPRRRRTVGAVPGSHRFDGSPKTKSHRDRIRPRN